MDTLCEEVCKLVEDGIKKLTSFKNDKIDYDFKARAALDEVRVTASKGFDFVTKVEDLQYYAREMNQAARYGDTDRQLMELLPLVRNCAAKAEKQYAIFDEACKKNTQMCMGAAKKCRQENGWGKILYPVLGAIAIVGFGVYALGALGIYGISTRLGFSLTTVGAAGGGCLIHLVGTFADLAATFDEMYDTIKQMREEVIRVRAQAKQVEESLCDFEFCVGKNHSTKTLSYITDRMEEKLRHSEATLSRERLKKML